MSFKHFDVLISCQTFNIIHLKGGSTNFTSLGIDFKPKRGSAILWPSVLNEDPSREDSRTYHEAKKVIDGVKFAANAWLHLRDYETPDSIGCT